MPAQPNDQEFSTLGISGRTSWVLRAQQAASTPGQPFEAGVTVKLQNAEISALEVAGGRRIGPASRSWHGPQEDVPVRDLVSAAIEVAASAIRNCWMRVMRRPARPCCSIEC